MSSPGDDSVDDMIRDVTVRDDRLRQELQDLRKLYPKTWDHRFRRVIRPISGQKRRNLVLNLIASRYNTSDEWLFAIDVVGQLGFSCYSLESTKRVIYQLIHEGLLESELGFCNGTYRPRYRFV